jgi:NAD(P)H-dependent FMN reductase
MPRFDYSDSWVTPEYNDGIPGALKNAIDFLFRGWNNRAAGFVSYGSAGGARAVEQLRLVMAEVQIAANRHDPQSSLAFLYLPTSRTSASSSLLPSTRSLSTNCLTRLLPGAAR